MQGRFERLTGFLRTRFLVSLTAVVGGIAGVTAALRATITAALEQEDAVRRLDAALAPLGDRASQVSQELQEQAAALQQVTRFGDEAIIEAQALLATLGVQADQLPQATEATLDLASAFGFSLEQAARNVGRTVGGFAGELGEIVPELRNLSTEALRSGEGIQLLADRFAGRAQQDVQTFRGRLQQLRNAFGDLLEDLGESITQNDALAGSLQRLTQTLQSGGTVDAVRSLASIISTLATNMVESARDTADFARGLRDIGRAASDASGGLLDFEASMSDVVGGVEGGNRAFFDLLDVIRQFGRQARLAESAQEGLANQQRRMADAFRDSVLSIFNAREEVSDYREEVEGLARAQSDAIAASDAYHAKLAELGVELEANVNAQIEENNEFLEQNRDLLRSEEITLRDFQRIQAQVSSENERLTRSLRRQNDTVEPLGEGYRQAADGLRGYQNVTRGATTDLDRFTRAQERANREVERGQQLAGRSGSTFGGTLSGGSALFPDSAIANTAVRGGQRVRVLPDGRRVLV